MAAQLVYGQEISFAAGEISPGLSARTDLSKYNTGLKTARNVLISPHGGVRNRPGTKFVAVAGNSSYSVRLIPFNASATEAYVIELGQYYARFYTSGGQVQVSGVSAWVTGTAYAIGSYVTQSSVTYYCLVAHTAGTFATDLAAGDWVAMTALQIPTPWAAADLFALKFAQSADVIYFAHQSYAPQQIAFSGGSWSVAPYQFVNGPFMPQNTATGKTLTPSATTNTAGSSVTVSKVVSSTGWFDVVDITFTSAHGLNVGDKFIITGMTGRSSQLNGLTLTAQAIVSTTVVQIVANPVVGDFSETTGGTMNKVGPITLTANFALFQSDHVGALFQLTQTIVAQTESDSATANSYTGDSIQCGDTWSIITLGTWTGKIIIQASIDGTNWTPIQTLQGASTNFTTSGSTGYSQCYIRVVGDGVTTWSGTLTYDLTAASFDWNGVVQIFAYTSSTSVTANVLSNTENAWPLASTNATWQWSEGSWSAYRGWPGSVTFNQDRLCWGGTPTEPAVIQCSKTSSYLDFGVSAPSVASDAFSILLPSRQLNAIQNLVVMPQGMIALTTDSEWMISPGTDGAFSATDVQVQIQGQRGSSQISPIVVGLELLLMQRMGTVCRNLIYQLAVNGFFGDNISIVSQHLFTGYTIVEMAYQQEPDSIAWAIRSDGALLSCTYMRDQELNAWTRHDTLGKFESICTIPDFTDGYSQPWVLVNRTIGGQTVRSIEYIMPRDQGTAPADQFFVDCGLTYSGSAATTITGLSYLNGQTVSILADGNVIPAQVVASGQIVLTAAASKVTVGLPYVSDVETLHIVSPSPWYVQPPGTMLGRRTAIPEMSIRFWNSRGGWYRAVNEYAVIASTGTTGFDELKQRYAGDDPTVAMPLKTLDYKVTLNGSYDMGAHVFFRQVDPLPFHILAFLPKCVFSEN